MCFLFLFRFEPFSNKKKNNQHNKISFLFFPRVFFLRNFFLLLFKPDVLVELDLPLANKTSEVLIHAQSQRGDYPVGFVPKRPWEDMAHVLYECDMISLVQNGNN